MESGTLKPRELIVFVSYSRDDTDFADQLDAALRSHKYEVVLDRHGIAGGENWENRLGALIRDSDTVVFVLSPTSARSDTCAWEVSEAVRLGKRIIPVVCRPLQDASPPSELASLNYIFFYAEPRTPGSGFGAGLASLVAALNNDRDWLREHTRLLARAMEWQAAGREANRMLIGADIAQAQAWAAHRPKDAPAPTDLQLEFIKASEDEETSRASAQRKQLEERERLLRGAEADRHLKEQALERAQAALAQTVRLKRMQAWGASLALAVFGAIAWWSYGAIKDQRAISREAAREDIRGQIAAYATDEGEFEADRAPGYETSPYTTPLARNLLIPNKSVSEILEATHKEATQLALMIDPTQKNGPTQRPFFSTSLNGHIYLWKQPANRHKRALVISAFDPGLGNGHVLTGPIHDTAAIADVLGRAGFDKSEIVRLENPTVSSIDDAIGNISASLQKAAGAESKLDGSPTNTLLLIFFSGHGVTIDASRYIVTNVLGAHREDMEAIKSKLVEVRKLLKAARDAAAASVVILDTHFPDCSGKRQQGCLQSSAQ